MSMEKGNNNLPAWFKLVDLNASEKKIANTAFAMLGELSDEVPSFSEWMVMFLHILNGGIGEVDPLLWSSRFHSDNYHELWDYENGDLLAFGFGNKWSIRSYDRGPITVLDTKPFKLPDYDGLIGAIHRQTVYANPTRCIKLCSYKKVQDVKIPIGD